MRCCSQPIAAGGEGGEFLPVSAEDDTGNQVLISRFIQIITDPRPSLPVCRVARHYLLSVINHQRDDYYILVNFLAIHT